MLALDELARGVRPERTVLLLGAGAAVTSGAPTGAGLATFLAAQLTPRPSTDDLAQVCGIWEIRKDRQSLVKAVRERLVGLQPSNALLTLPTYPWRHIYSTNFDQLVEKAYRSANKSLDVIRSNYDFHEQLSSTTRLYKLHGCVSQDVAFGQAARLVLTERDYDHVKEYREAVFRSLAFDLTTADTLVIGQSLSDAHLRQLAKEASALRTQSGTPGRVFMVVYERDDDQAALLEQFGLTVCFGSLEDLAYQLGQATTSELVASSTSPIGGLLPSRLAPACIDVAHASMISGNALRLFNGASATYGDIATGLTVERAVEQRLLETQDSRQGFFTAVTGVAGVGKTTLARRILYRRSEEGFACWETLDAYPIDVDGWLEVEANLRRAKRQGFLLIDDCTRSLGSVNRLADKLAALDRPFLRLVVTANAGAWSSRHKSRAFFSRGNQMKLGRLTDVDLERFVNLVDAERRINELVEPSFKLLSKAQQRARLRDRCSAEMYVCLKNIFGSNELDYILLNEYSALGEAERDVYRHVAALQAMGAKVHRQLVLRCLNVEAGQLDALLTLLEGIVEEYVVNASEGLYRWSVRHDVIAGVIAQYNFADSQQLRNLFEVIISGINPGVFMELETARALCTTDWGIPRLTDPDDQITLFRQLIAVLPAERIPRRRLIKRYLDSRDLGEAAQAIKSARAAFGGDTIVDRYEVLMSLYRAEEDSQLLPQYRLAILNEALRKGKALASSGFTDKHNIRVLADVAVAIARRTGDTSEIEAAVQRFYQAEEELLDPEIGRLALQYERVAHTLRPFAERGSQEPAVATDEPPVVELVEE